MIQGISCGSLFLELIRVSALQQFKLGFQFQQTCFGRLVLRRTVLASQDSPPLNSLEVIAQHVNAADSEKYLCRASQQIRKPLRICKCLDLFAVEQEQLNQFSRKDIADKTLPTSREFHIFRAVNKYGEPLGERTASRPLATDRDFLTGTADVDE
ncbi:hypothetical protein WJ78_24585 [Burkholderia ubonensis]|nr:hypothetical protein WJ78_24585 [Burkholderia ubonensis]KVP91228.1 hypothetical protein WJ97_03680 [Burkholderia ubonensis]OJB45015.1 hypothetical protein BGV57_06150 [Burkholderia ubonensis]